MMANGGKCPAQSGSKGRSRDRMQNQSKNPGLWQFPTRVEWEVCLR